jgi:hypothetical protein
MRMELFGLFVLAALAGLSIYRRQTQDKLLQVVYEDDRDPVVRQLNLS